MQDNNTKIYSTNNDGKFVAAERISTTFINKIYEYITSVFENAYIDKLDETVNKYNNTYHNIIEMRPFDVKSSTKIDFGVKNNDKDPEFKFIDHARISRYKKILGKIYTSNWSEEKILKNLKS